MNKDYWDKLIEKYEKMSDEEFAKKIEECDKLPDVNIVLPDLNKNNKK